MEVPATVVMGAKGSGKTFLYKEMLKKRYWESFSDGIQTTIPSSEICKTLIIPLLASKKFW